MRPVLLGILAVVLVSCTTGGQSFETVDELYEAAGGAEWCDGDLVVVLPPYVANCGDPAGDSRVVLGVSGGGAEIRTSIEAAREHLVEDDQLLLVPADPDQEVGWQLRSRDPDLLRAAQERIGGVLLDSEAEVDEWLEQ